MSSESDNARPRDGLERESAEREVLERPRKKQSHVAYSLIIICSVLAVFICCVSFSLFCLYKNVRLGRTIKDHFHRKQKDLNTHTQFECFTDQQLTTEGGKPFGPDKSICNIVTQPTDTYTQYSVAQRDPDSQTFVNSTDKLQPLNQMTLRARHPSGLPLPPVPTFAPNPKISLFSGVDAEIEANRCSHPEGVVNSQFSPNFSSPELVRAANVVQFLPFAVTQVSPFCMRLLV